MRCVVQGDLHNLEHPSPVTAGIEIDVGGKHNAEPVIERAIKQPGLISGTGASINLGICDNQDKNLRSRWRTLIFSGGK